MKQLLMYSALLLVVFLLIDCSMDANDESAKLEPLQNDLDVWIEENPYPDRARVDEIPCLKLVLRSQEDYPSSAYSLVHSFQRTGNSIYVKVDGVRNAGMGADVMTPIGGACNFNLDPGNYEVFLRYNDSIDNYRVMVNEDVIITTPQQQSFTDSYWDFYYRYMEDTFACYIWGWYELGSEQVELYEAFLDTIRATPGIIELVYPDECVHALTSHLYERTAKQVAYFQFESLEQLFECHEKLDLYNEEVYNHTGWYPIEIMDWDREY